MQRFLALILALPFLNAGAQNAVPLDIGNNETYDGFSPLDSAVKHSRILIIGENRDYASFNSRLEFKTLKYLNQRFGMRNYLLAMAPSKAFLVDRFVNSDDSAMETLLKSVSTPRYMKLYRNLKKLNKKRPDSLRIRVFGIDVERSSSLPAVRIAGILPENNIPDRLRIGVESIRGAARYIIEEGLKEYERQLENKEEFYFEPRQFSVRQSVEEFMHYYDSLESEFKAWLGADFIKLAGVMKGLREYRQYQNWRETAFEDVWREDRIYQNVVALMDSLKGEKFFTVYGRCHLAYQELNGPCGLYGFSSLARRLSLTRNAQYQPLSMAVFYTSENRLDEDMSDEPSAMKEEVKMLAESAPARSAIIIHLSGATDARLLRANYDFVLLENGYPLVADADSAGAGIEEAIPDLPVRSVRIARLYLGGAYVQPYIDFSAMNAVLASRGLEQVSDPYAVDWQAGVLTAENVYTRWSYGTSSSGNGLYHSSRWMSSAGANVLNAESRSKLVFGYHMGWHRHRIVRASGNTPSTPLKDLETPQTFFNPATLLGLFSMAKIDFRFIYLFAEAGYLRDVSDSRWRYDGHFTGDVGRLKSHQLYWMLGAGLSVPLTFDSSNEEVYR